MTQNKSKVSPFFQVALMIIGTLIIAYTLYLRTTSFYIQDTVVHVLPITHEKQKEFGEFPVKVTTGLFIKEFEKFDIIKNEFIFNGTIWFLVHPGLVSVNTLNGFSFENAEIVKKSEPSIKFLEDKIFVSYDLKVQFSSPISFKDFPVDDHRLYLKLINKQVLPGELMFISSQSDFKISAQTDIWGWKLLNKSVETGYSEDKLELKGDEKRTLTYPTALFSLDYEQNNVRNTLTILLPLLLIFYLSLLSFSLEEGPSSWRLPLTGLTITVSYRFVMENLSPKVGYFMTSDYLYIVYVAVTCIIFLFNIVDYKYVRTNRVVKSLIVLLLQVLVIGSNVYFLSR